MRRITSILSAIALAALPACSAEQALQTAETYKNTRIASRSANATGMAGSAMAAQSALYHIASALSSQVAKEGNAKAFRVSQAAGQPTYTIDLAAGTGAVQLMRGDKKAIDLSFKFEKESRDGGLLYNVSSLRGTVEGFQILLPRLLLTYTPALSEAGDVIKDAKGDTVFQVSVKANGFLGVDNRAAFQIADMAFGVRYPFPEGETRLGAIKLFSPEGLTFEGEAFLNGQAVSAKGKVSDAAGTKLYDLAVTADGQVALTPLATPAPAAPTP
ncbi:hypothetical protein D3C72_518560 [compost metagenome]